MEQQLRDLEVDYTTKSKLILFIGTWNVGGREPPYDTDLRVWLNPSDNLLVPDIYVIGLQEMVALNAKTVVEGKNVRRIAKWEDLIEANISKNQKYFNENKMN